MAEAKIGKDEWVSQHASRRSAPRSLRDLVYGYGEQVPMLGRLAILLVIAIFIPLVTDNSFHIRIAGSVALMAMLAMGLHVIVGYAGMLDLGFVAFYGIGGYAYAYLSSDFIQFIDGGVHLPTYVSLPIIALFTALVGLLLGLPSLRLLGDYLAIVTLAFGQIFVQLMTTLTRVSVPGQEDTVNLTGGPNGIIRLDPFSLPFFTADSITDYYFVMVVFMLITLLFVHHLNTSRLGRAWRALREDELATEAMGMPTRRLKLTAFAIGAGIAGLSGALFASWQGSVFPANFDVVTLITLYAIIVLGGLGSLPGVLVGAVVMVTIPQILRDADLATNIFYGGVILSMVAMLKPRWKSPVMLAALIIFGIIVKAILGAIWQDSLVTEIDGSNSVFAFFIDAVRDWLAVPLNDVTRIGNFAFGALVILILVSVRLPKGFRFYLMIPTLYLLLFVWETRLSQEPSVTRLIIVGTLLVVLMIFRPQGLLGERRVEIV
jgi:branched-chain amino acid transport system permease protein